jgi:hypothetical protein
MNLISSILLAEQTRGASLSEAFRNRAGFGRDDALLGLLIAAAAIAGMWAASRLLGLRRRHRGYHSPSQLFKALCSAHRLRWSDRWLLGRLARHRGLSDPARLFLEAQLWEEQSLGPAFALEFPRLRALRKQLFDGTTDAVAAESEVRAGYRGHPAVKPRAGATPTAGATPASPLFPTSPAPTLDVPPWTDAQSVEL